ncbi:hypothetical protein [Nocardia sp. NPDC004750]
MSLNPFSLFGLVAALDDSNIRAHLTGTVADCTVCTTTSSPDTACPAGRAAELTHTKMQRSKAIDIVDHLAATKEKGETMASKTDPATSNLASRPADRAGAGEDPRWPPTQNRALR